MTLFFGPIIHVGHLPLYAKKVEQRGQLPTNTRTHAHITEPWPDALVHMAILMISCKWRKYKYKSESAVNGTNVCQ